MSVFSGGQGKYAMRKHRENKRLDAAEREADTVRVMREQNISRTEAQWVAKASRRLAREVGARAERGRVS